ncbi:MAG: twin-arginine translocase TatA/TatE family subunit [Planctomycetota bacterium]
MFAFLPTLGLPEMILLLVIGLLLYGRNLPQAGRTMGRFVAQMKRGFQDFKDQMDRDESLREVRKTIQDTTREMRNLTNVPRAIANPGQALRELAHDTMTAPAPEGPHEPETEERADEPPPPPSPPVAEGVKP